MVRLTLPLASILAPLVAVALAAQPAPPQQGDPALPEGPGRDLTVKLCKNCHPLDKVVGVRRTNAEWITMVEKMLAQGAEGTTDELNAVIDYLTDHYGKPVRVNEAKAEDLVNGLGIADTDAAGIVAYRTAHGPFASLADLVKVPGIDVPIIQRRQKNLVFGGLGNGNATVTGRGTVTYGR
jgi:competence protein ComEA